MCYLQLPIRREHSSQTLNKEDFKVFEDDKPQSISNFSNETNLPLSVALVLDTSASITGRLKFEQEAAGEFFYSALRSGTDKALVVAFDRSVALLQDYTDNSELLTRAVGRVQAARRCLMPCIWR